MRRLLSLLPVLCILLATSVAVAQEAPAADVAGEAEMLSALNAMRAADELPALARSAELDAIARAHSAEMAQNGALAHVSEATGSPEDRVRSAGLATSAVAENVAMHRDAAQAQAALTASAPHQANMRSADVTHVGIGVVRTAQGVYATQLFAALEAPAAPEPPPATPIATPEEAPAPLFGIIPPFVESTVQQAAQAGGAALERGPAAIEETLGGASAADDASPAEPAPVAEAAPGLQSPAASPAPPASAAAPNAAATLRQLVGLAQSLLGAPAAQ